MLNPFRSRSLSRRRLVLALLLALAADALQIALGPIGWAFFDEIIDVIAMVLISLLVGFHPLFLPTFVVEFIPVVDMLPTWTACVSTVVLLRRRVRPPFVSTPPPPPPTGPRASTPVIDV